MDVGIHGAEDVVRYRLGLPHLHAFAASLGEQERAAFVADAVDAVVRSGAGFAPRVCRGGRGRLSPVSRACGPPPRGTPARGNRPRAPRAPPAGWRSSVACAETGRVGDVGRQPPPLERRDLVECGQVRGHLRFVDGLAEPGQRRRADQPAEHGVALVAALLGRGGRPTPRPRAPPPARARPGPAGRGCRPRRWSKRHLLWNRLRARLGLRDREPVRGGGESPRAQQAVGHVEVALGEDLLRARQLESLAGPPPRRRGRRGCAAASCGRCAAPRRNAPSCPAVRSRAPGGRGPGARRRSGPAGRRRAPSSGGCARPRSPGCRGGPRRRASARGSPVPRRAGPGGPGARPPTPAARARRARRPPPPAPTRPARRSPLPRWPKATAIRLLARIVGSVAAVAAARPSRTAPSRSCRLRAAQARSSSASPVSSVAIACSASASAPSRSPRDIRTRLRRSRSGARSSNPIASSSRRSAPGQVQPGQGEVGGFGEARGRQCQVSALAGVPGQLERVRVRSLGEHLGRAPVDPGPPRAADLGGDRQPHQVVAEGQASRRARRGTPGRPRCRGGPARRAAASHHGGEQVQVDAGPQDRGRLERRRPRRRYAAAGPTPSRGASPGPGRPLGRRPPGRARSAGARCRRCAPTAARRGASPTSSRASASPSGGTSTTRSGPSGARARSRSATTTRIGGSRRRPRCASQDQVTGSVSSPLSSSSDDPPGPADSGPHRVVELGEHPQAERVRGRTRTGQPGRTARVGVRRRTSGTSVRLAASASSTGWSASSPFSARPRSTTTPRAAAAVPQTSRSADFPAPGSPVSSTTRAPPVDRSAPRPGRPADRLRPTSGSTRPPVPVLAGSSRSRTSCRARVSADGSTPSSSPSELAEARELGERRRGSTGRGLRAHQRAHRLLVVRVVTQRLGGEHRGAADLPGGQRRAGRDPASLRHDRRCRDPRLLGPLRVGLVGEQVVTHQRQGRLGRGTGARVVPGVRAPQRLGGQRLELGDVPPVGERGRSPRLGGPAGRAPRPRRARLTRTCTSRSGIAGRVLRPDRARPGSRPRPWRRGRGRAA